MDWATDGQSPAHAPQVPCWNARRIRWALWKIPKMWADSSTEIIGGICFGRGIVPGDALRTRHRWSFSIGGLAAPQAPAAPPLPGTCPLDLRLNEFTLSSLSRSAVFFIGAQ